MQRVPEPELMDDAEQALAYARADFSEAHQHFVELFQGEFPPLPEGARILDLGCGTADVTIRLARALPTCRVDGLDGAAAMLTLGREAVVQAGLDGRIRLEQGYLPGACPPRASYDAVVSNSLLHHLENPKVLWDSIRRWGQTGAPVLVMDLLRPDSVEAARDCVDRYAADAPEILRRDFFNSLLAAYRTDEVHLQLRAAGLAGWDVRAVSDRHWAVLGRMP